MYGKDFWERLDVRRLCAYIQSGEDTVMTGAGTLEERSRHLGQRWYGGLDAYRDAVLETDWSAGDRTLLTEDLIIPLEHVRWDLKELSFEAGFCAGVKVARSLNL